MTERQRMRERQRGEESVCAGRRSILPLTYANRILRIHVQPSDYLLVGQGELPVGVVLRVHVVESEVQQGRGEHRMVGRPPGEEEERRKRRGRGENRR